MRNVRLGFRALSKSPFVTGIAILSLALGIGANTAIYSLFRQVLLQPLPVARPGELVNLTAPGPKPGSQSCSEAGDCDHVFSYPMFRDLERAQTVFTGIAAHRAFRANLAFRAETLSSEGMLVSGSYFPVLGLQPALGRLIGPGDDAAPGEAHVAVLAWDYWRTRFDQDPRIVGEPLIVNGQALTIVGIAPPGFSGTTLGVRPAVFVPITMRALMEPTFKGFDNRRSYWAYLFARLTPGVGIDQAASTLNGAYHAIVNDVEAPLQTGMSDQTMTRFRAKTVVASDGSLGQSSMRRDGRAPLLMLFAVTAVVLVIACANIANLLLARGAARAGEMAVRLSLGAARRHLVGQLLTESCLLATFGGLGGLLVARATLAVLPALFPADDRAALTFTMDTAALLFTLGVSVVTGLVFGLFPAWHSTRPDLVTALKNQAGQPSGARTAAWFRTALATTQIALSMALLVSSGLLVRSLVNVSRVDLGIRTDHVVAFGVSPELNGYSAERSRALFERLEDDLAAVPGVTSVSAALVPLLAGSSWGSSVSVPGFTATPDTDTVARYNEIAPGYFRTFGVPLLAGREFTRADAAGATKVTVVNEAFLRKFNLGRDAIGTRIGTTRSGPIDTEIVGIVPDTKYNDVKEPAPPLFVTPYRQDDEVGALTFYVRSSLPVDQMLGAIPPLVARADPNLPVERLKTMDVQVRDNVFADRLITILAAAFAGLATLLAAVGLYGVLAYTVAERTREIGLRMALGADAGAVRGMVLKRVAWMTLVGGVVGLAAAVALGRVARSLLFEMQSHDPAALSGAAVALTAVSLAAGFVPAYRASRIDPLVALRCE